MRKFTAAFLLGAALATIAPAPVAFTPQAEAQTSRRTLSGEWQGVYFQGPDNRAVEFTASLNERGGRFTGTILEQNMFGDNSTFWLFADVVGYVSVDAVHLTKTYDGTGGQAHTVEYQGRLTNGGRRIVGTWSIGADRGSFEMAR